MISRIALTPSKPPASSEAMSQENVEVVYRAYDALRRRDKEAFVRELHPDVEGVVYIMEPEGTVYRGHPDMRRFIDELLSVFPDWHPEVVRATDYGDTVLAELRLTGRGCAFRRPARADHLAGSQVPRRQGGLVSRI
jgi:ketosteroid isomerase-like protein